MCNKILSQLQQQLDEILCCLMRMTRFYDFAQLQAALISYDEIIQNSIKKLLDLQGYIVQKQLNRLRMVKFYQLLEQREKRAQDLLRKYVLKEYCHLENVFLCNKLVSLFRQLGVTRIKKFNKAVPVININQITQFSMFIVQLKKKMKAYIKDNQDSTLKLNIFQKQSNSEIPESSPQLDVSFIEQIMLSSLLKQAKVKQLHFYLKGIFFVSSGHISNKFAWATKMQIYQLRMKNTKIIIVGNHNLSYLKDLKLEKVNIDVNTIRIFSTFIFNKLEHFEVTNNKITNKGVYYLAKANWPNLKRLQFNQGCQITSDALKWLLKGIWPSLQFISIRQFNLHSNSIFVKYYYPQNSKGSRNYYGRRFLQKERNTVEYLRTKISQ